MDYMEIIALEFGYSQQIINYAMKTTNIRNSADFVTYLWDNEERLEFESEVDDKEMKKLAVELQDMELCSTSCVNEVVHEEVTVMKEMTMYEETLRLLSLHSCKICKVQPRNILNLPCCHLALCSDCNRNVSHCYLSDCKELIQSTIKTFIM